jgi:hypothetical protein
MKSMSGILWANSFIGRGVDTHHVRAWLGPQDVVAMLLLGQKAVELDPVGDNDRILAHVSANGLGNPLGRRDDLVAPAQGLDHRTVELPVVVGPLKVIGPVQSM